MKPRHPRLFAAYIMGGIATVCAIAVMVGYSISKKRTGKCITNMRQMTSIIYAVAEENQLNEGAVVPTNTLSIYTKEKDAFLCPSGGKYRNAVVGGKIECSVHGCVR